MTQPTVLPFQSTLCKEGTLAETPGLAPYFEKVVGILRGYQFKQDPNPTRFLWDRKACVIAVNGDSNHRVSYLVSGGTDHLRLGKDGGGIASLNLYEKLDQAAPKQVYDVTFVKALFFVAPILGGVALWYAKGISVPLICGPMSPSKWFILAVATWHPELGMIGLVHAGFILTKQFGQWGMFSKAGLGTFLGMVGRALPLALFAYLITAYEGKKAQNRIKDHYRQLFGLNGKTDERVENFEGIWQALAVTIHGQLEKLRDGKIVLDSEEDNKILEQVNTLLDFEKRANAFRAQLKRDHSLNRNPMMLNKIERDLTIDPIYGLDLKLYRHWVVSICSEYAELRGSLGDSGTLRVLWGTKFAQASEDYSKHVPVGTGARKREIERTTERLNREIKENERQETLDSVQTQDKADKVIAKRAELTKFQLVTVEDTEDGLKDLKGYYIVAKHFAGEGGMWGEANTMIDHLKKGLIGQKAFVAWVGNRIFPEKMLKDLTNEENPSVFQKKYGPISTEGKETMEDIRLAWLIKNDERFTAEAFGQKHRLVLNQYLYLAKHYS